MKKLLMISVCMSVCAAPAMAMDHGPGPGGKMFRKADANSDGRITRGEHEIFSRRMFEKLDANGDGAISQEEMQEHRKERMEKRKEHREGMHKKRRHRSAGDDIAPGGANNKDLKPAGD